MFIYHYFVKGMNNTPLFYEQLLFGFSLHVIGILLHFKDPSYEMTELILAWTKND